MFFREPELNVDEVACDATWGECVPGWLHVCAVICGHACACECAECGQQIPPDAAAF